MVQGGMMTNSQYPRFGQVRHHKPQGKCVICGNGKAEKRVDVQINIFRGDDEVYKVHAKCIEGLGNQWTVFILHKEIA